MARAIRAWAINQREEARIRLGRPAIEYMFVRMLRFEETEASISNENGV